MEHVFFVSGGSEAVESAIKLARQHAVATGAAGSWKIISRFPSYHGSTLGALALTGYTPMTAPFDAMMRPMPKVPAPRAYLDGLDATDCAVGEHYAAMLEQKIIEEGADTVLAFIVEPVGGAATGALVPPAGYLQAVRRICDRYGVLLIHDEVMSGGGRTGRFFAAEHWGVTPDIIAISKGFGAGYVPLGAMIARQPLVDAVLDSGGFIHGYTYAGNPLACAAGLAVLEEIERQDMMTNAVSGGERLAQALKSLQRDCPLIGDVRGMGLLLAFELVADPTSLQPLPRELQAFDRLVEIAYEKGLIIYSRRTRGGTEGDHFLVCPPMITTEAQVGEIAELLHSSLLDFMKAVAPELERRGISL
jgi:adenosylmethionine-8-amino-7-oxononanoate aminotransferase